MQTVGFIGTGNMGGALALAVSKSGIADIKLANRTKQKALDLAKQINGEVVDNLKAANCDFVFLGVKPYQGKEVIEQIKNSFKDNTIVVSMMASWNVEQLHQLIDKPIIRIMPNTPVCIGEGMSLYVCSDDVSNDDEQLFLQLMKESGKLAKVEEKLFDAIATITSCGPAFVDMYIDALADAGVKLGIAKKSAIEYAAQMLVGSAKLVMQSDKHPVALKDEVCSPAGSTIEGVISLEKNNFRNTVIEAILASYDKLKK